MQEFPANSQRARTRPDGEPEKIERVVTSAETVRRKRGLGRQVKETFIGGSARGAFEYMVTDVVVPAIQTTILDALQGGLERLIRGDTRPRRGYAPSSNNDPNLGRFNYQSISAANRGHAPPPQRMLSRQARARGTFDDIVIPTRPEAEEVLDRMYEILHREGEVKVAELYELTGIQTSHTDHRWGWHQLRGARVTPLRSGGYLLDLPEPESL